MIHWLELNKLYWDNKHKRLCRGWGLYNGDIVFSLSSYIMYNIMNVYNIIKVKAK